MKRLFALLCAAMLVGVMLCSCTGTANKVKEKASEAVSDIKKDMKDSVTENKSMVDNNGTVQPTDATDSAMMETIEDAVATEWDNMKEDGKVNDGDGNVGDRENNDGDGNPAPEN
ncbi:hypothetical protein [Ruminococcus sp.]|jgi:hypothetical protein|uniref:hypothetical protein n=1 Tax=Ruminococcus sp. TaxID=41978 RepID=UPI00386A037E